VILEDGVLTPEERTFVCIHEAGHAFIYYFLGIEFYATFAGDELPDAVAYCQPSDYIMGKYSGCGSLGGVLATRLFCRDHSLFEQGSTWEYCCEDLRLFNNERNGMTYRQARQWTLFVLRENKDKVLKMAKVLDEVGRIDYSNRHLWE
jgi:hypothetical protein